MPKKPTKSASTARTAPQLDPALAPVVAAFARDRRVSTGRIFVSTGLKVDGKVFAFVRQGTLVLKLPQARVAELIAVGDGAPFDRGRGTPMREWVSIASGHGDWVALAKEARAFVATVK